MDTRFWDKATLYGYVDALKKQLSISQQTFPVDSKVLAGQYTRNLTIEVIPFPSDKICGILYRGDNSTSIALNASRSPNMQNFDCMHELIHYFFHDINYCQRICCEENGTGGKIEQDTYIEWQANEGAAQFLVPYQDFIPTYVSLSRKYAHDSFAETNVVEILADMFFVSQKVISNRIDTLNYEIYTYLNGVPITNIIPRSKSNLKKFNWNLQHRKEYCKACLSPVQNNFLFCPICGGPLTSGDFWGRIKYVNLGAGYMLYPGVELNENGQVTRCPTCCNEEHLQGAVYCMICGKPAINQCSFAVADDVPSGYAQCPHDEPLPGNARYCPYCGCETTFLRKDLLLPWNAPTAEPFAVLDVNEDGEIPF